jgi:uncharacterized membrane protein
VVCCCIFWTGHSVYLTASQCSWSAIQFIVSILLVLFLVISYSIICLVKCISRQTFVMKFCFLYWSSFINSFLQITCWEQSSQISY